MCYFGAASAAGLAALLPRLSGQSLVIGTTGELPEKALAAYAQGAAVAIVPNFSAGVPMLIDLIRAAVTAMPEEWEVEIVEAHHNQKKDAPSGTAKLLGSQNLQASFRVLAGPIKNAVALPNGRIYIWEGLLVETQEDEDMLAGVIAHELGHLSHDHFLTRVQWAALARFVLGIVGGSIVRQLLQNAAATVISRGFTRGHELEADETAIGLMQSAGYDPSGLARLLERLAQDTPASGMLGSHPEPRSRAARIRTRLNLAAPPVTTSERPESTTSGTVIQFPGGSQQ